MINYFTSACASAQYKNFNEGMLSFGFRLGTISEIGCYASRI